jgi:hypothetical protein
VILHLGADPLDLLLVDFRSKLLETLKCSRSYVSSLLESLLKCVGLHLHGRFKLLNDLVNPPIPSG